MKPIPAANPKNRFAASLVEYFDENPCDRRRYSMMEGDRSGVVAEAPPSPMRQAAARLGDRRSLLATLPEATFFRRYRETFAS